jgi:hypothetical protein
MNKIKKYIKTLMLAVVAIVMCGVMSGCQNNGDIGPWYGSWLLTEMTVDGEPYTKPFEGDLFVYWSFQNGIVSVTRTDKFYNMDVTYGRWEATDTELLLNFDNTDDLDEDNSSRYGAPTYLLMDPNAVEHLQFVSNNWKTMVLSYVNAQGQKIIYTIKKEF